jgi:dTDP-4-dehydrorhamnose reductase
MRLAILGSSGMLGSMLLDFFAHQTENEIVATTRRKETAERLGERLSSVSWRILDAELCDVQDVVRALEGVSWAVNAIGVIKPRIHDDNASEVERATKVNSVFPHTLARAAEKTSCRVIQIGTDCVYSGLRGNYSESDWHDALDVYGKTKSLGEVFSQNVFHLRCSIIGPEPANFLSLFEWFLRQPKGSSVNGFTNQKWNGITTLHFAKICLGIFANDIELPHVQHLIPSGLLTKYDLLRTLSDSYKRQDLNVRPAEAPSAVDRTLTTINSELNRKLWQSARYDHIPTIAEMVSELASFNYSFRGALTKS